LKPTNLPLVLARHTYWPYQAANKTIHAFLFSDEEKSTPISIIITNTHIALADENHQWPLPRLHDPPKFLSGPQFVLKKKQKIINVTDVVRLTNTF
jgi:hypothetical protein